MGEILSPLFERDWGLCVLNFKIADFDLQDEDMDAVEDAAAEKQRQEKLKEYLAELERLDDKQWEREKYLRQLELQDRAAYYEVLKVIGDYAFQNCVLLERFNSDVIGTADLSGNIETVGDYAYYGCQNLTQIVIPSSIHMVGDHAFDGCRNIKELNLTDRITVIGEYAFQGMQLLTAVTVYNSTNSIGRGAFQGCNNIVDIILPFTGKNDTAVQTEKDGYEAVFGWIFGYRYEYNSSINGGASQGFYNKQVSSTDGTICQYVYIPSNEKYYHAEYLYYYYIPTTLRNGISRIQEFQQGNQWRVVLRLTEDTRTVGWQGENHFA